ncbi:MAG: apolipoprotein N-acyltransferase [Magnetococcales bacterium]|nr:apolipoprotein N-acyltransferase [Magnetococcales bacterium]
MRPVAASFLAPFLAITAGAAGVLGLPPYGWVVATILALALLIALVWSVTPRRAAWYGFLFGLVHFTWGCHWLVTSLHQHGGIALPLAWLMLLALAAILAIYPALFAALLGWLLPPAESGARLAWLAPTLWVGLEWLRAHLFTGFPWNLIGYAWNDWPVVLQSADLLGVYGLSWLLLWLAAMVVRVVLWLGQQQWRAVVLQGLLPVVLVLALVYGYGSYRQQQLLMAQQSAATLRVAMVQGNVPQQLKWDRAFMATSLEVYQQLSRSLVSSDGPSVDLPVDLIVWPETAVVFYVNQTESVRRLLTDLSRQVGAPILTGAPTMELNPRRFYNSALLIDGSRPDTLQRYDKYHLVPFGEFIPLRWLLPTTLTKFTEGTEDFARGPGPEPMPWSAGALGILICYEAIFPDEVRQLAASGTRWLVNLTNDGWFGPSAKPQHLAMARLRAIENRLPMIRVANTGISAVFDQTGAQLGEIASDRRGVRVVTLPDGQGTPTLQQTLLPWLPWLCLFGCLPFWRVRVLLQRFQH